MSIILSTLNFSNEIRNKLSSLQNMDYIIDENSFGDYTLFKIKSLADDIDRKTQLKNEIIIALSNLIIDNLENKLINKIIYDDYEQQLSFKEKELVKEDSKKYIAANTNNTSNLLQKNKLKEILQEHLQEYKVLNIEGFIRFRLKDYLKKLKLIIEKSVDSYNIDQEYNEFIKLLRYFVDLQEPKIKKVNIIRISENSYKLLDSQKNDIKSEYLQDCVKDMLEQDEEFEFEDLIVSALVNISPNRIILHFRDENVEETLEEIFEDKLSFCQGCDLCTQKLKT